MGHWRKPQTGLQKFPRVATSVPVRITTVDPEVDPDTGRTFFRSADETTANLSRGGAYVRSWEPLASGRRVVLTIELPDRGELQLVGRVAWTRRELRPEAGDRLEAPGYGVEFADASTAELAALDRYLTLLESGATDDEAPSRQPALPRP
jgi:Tfp pilus assembly protein PilZ